MISLRQQIDNARRLKRWSIEKLLQESGLTCSRPSLHRKLLGGQTLRLEEYQALTVAVGIVPVWPKRGHVAARHGKRRGKGQRG